MMFCQLPAQNKFTYSHTLRFSASFATGCLFDAQSNPIYLQGLSEYYIDNKISFRNDGYFFINETSNPTFETNHQLFSGFAYHFLPDNSIDFYGSFQIGAAFAKAKYAGPVLDVVIDEKYLQKYTLTTNPVFAVGTGVNLFAKKWFHAFLELKYIKGRYLSNAPSIGLDEFRFSFGLGFNVNLKKAKAE